MGLEIQEPNTCIRGCCRSSKIPLHLPPSTFTLGAPIAKGAESVVYEARLDGKTVAVKKPVLSSSDHLDKFHKELQLFCKLDHPGLAMLVAAHAKPPNYMFFFPLYEKLNLADKLHVEEWAPTIDQVLTITFQLEYKEDLKPVSVHNWRSTGKPTGGFHKKNMVGTLIYMAPEILRKEMHTEKSDVYSFGVSINELLTGVVPYTDLRAAAQAHTVLEMNYTEQQLTAAVVSEGLRPVPAGLETGAPENLLSLIQKCWDSDSQKRPSFIDITMELEQILEQRINVQNSSKLSTPPDNQDVKYTNDSRYYQESINWYTLGQHVKCGAPQATDCAGKFWSDTSNDPMAYCPVLSWGSFATCGKRESMEDTHFLMPQMSNEKSIHIFGIFDGHRGAAAAEFSARALPGILQNLGSRSSPFDALSEAFVETDKSFRDELDSLRKSKREIQKNWHPGCTAVVALLIRNKLFVANAGDCRAILCRSGHPIALSKDHVASCPEERERVISAGESVKWQVDTWRVGAAALQVTRSIGDDDLKPAVTAEPEISEKILSSEDEYLVMASDGLWDVISNEEVVSIIRDTVKEPGMCAKRLATEAAERGSKDNITVIVVFLRPVSTAERIY